MQEQPLWVSWEIGLDKKLKEKEKKTKQKTTLGALHVVLPMWFAKWNYKMIFF